MSARNFFCINTVLLLLLHSSISSAKHQNHAGAMHPESGITARDKIVRKKSMGISEKEHVTELTVSYKWVSHAGKRTRAIAVNNQIPGPELHFREGEQVKIIVHNHLQEETAIHWHGVLVPWQMDGVQRISQKGIKPGESFTSQFRLMQSGTYWYHAHAELQEQQGLYGAFVIDPVNPSPWQYDRDFTIVLSDWIDTHPEKVLANLKKDGDYYSPKFPLQPSLLKFLQDYQKADKNEKKNLVHDYTMMQQMRMSLYDINDVAYDAFLLNGRDSSDFWKAIVKKGDTLRLRFIGAGAETVFRVKIPGAAMQMVHVQGNDVKPYPVKDFSIAPGETYDVLIKIDENRPYIIYAESLDTVGAAYGAFITEPQQQVDIASVQSFPEPPPVTREMMANMMQGSHGHHEKTGEKSRVEKSMDMGNHHHSAIDSKKTKPVRQLLQYAMNDHSLSMDHASMQMHDAVQEIPKKMADSSSVKSKKKKKTFGRKAEKAVHQETMHSESSMGSMQMDMPTEPAIIGDVIRPGNDSEKQTSASKYQNLKAQYPTNNPRKKIAGTINMELFGYMNHFIWMINGLPEYLAKPIILEPAKRYRFIFKNNSMMRHPMHIHGHWFILRNGHGKQDPLLHTIEVAPGATVIADIDTDASGQWFFHCHMNYHMAAGMARVFQYSSILEIVKKEKKPQNIVKNTEYSNRPIVRVDEARPLDSSLIAHPMGHHPGFWMANFLDIGADPFHNFQKLTYRGLLGGDYHKLELFINDAELHKTIENADMDIFYWHLLSQFWAVKGGANYFYRPATSPYWQPGFGLEGLLPWFIETDFRSYFYQGALKLDLEFFRDTQITNNFFIGAGIRGILASKTVSAALIGSGLNQMRYMIKPFYRLMPGMNIFMEYEYEKNYGSFRQLQLANGQSPTQNTLTFGLSLIL